MTATDSESRLAFRELLDALREIDERYIGAEAGSSDPRAVARDHRFLMHVLGGGLDLFFEADPEAPEFRPTLHAGRKFYGDNPDALYHSTMVRPELDYRIRGNMDGAVYVSFTVEGGGGIDDRYPPGRVVATRNDTALEIAPNGDYEILASRRSLPGSWLPLADDACSIVSRHYYEGEHPVDRSRRVPLEIEVLRPDGAVLPPAPDSTDPSTVAQGIRRVRNFVRGLSLDYERNGPPIDLAAAPPNRFPDPPEWRPDDGRAAVDQANQVARFSLGADEALLIDGRFPRCRFANVVLWNRRLQTLEFARRRSSLNRRQTELEPDGSFRMIVAHEDPGLANWLDTGGEREGLIFVRTLLPEERPLPLATRVVPLRDLRS